MYIENRALKQLEADVDIVHRQWAAVHQLVRLIGDVRQLGEEL